MTKIALMTAAIIFLGLTNLFLFAVVVFLDIKNKKLRKRLIKEQQISHERQLGIEELKDEITIIKNKKSGKGKRVESERLEANEWGAGFKG